jgi:pyrimidine-nucleoside phosphorylase
MKNVADAKELAETMVEIGNSVGRKTMAVISDMDQPLGFAIGNALEVKEAIATLKGTGPQDLTELCLTLGSQMVYLAKKAESVDEARQMLISAIQSGKALEKMKSFITSQGGDATCIDDPEKLPQAKYKIELPAKASGWIEKMMADKIGLAAMQLGAGRETKESKIDLAVGIVLNKKVGDPIEQGESILTIYSNSENIEEVKNLLYHSIKISHSKISPPPLIHEIISK